MPSIFIDKLNLKEQTEILVLNVPESFEPELRSLSDVSAVRSPEELEAIEFSLAFVTQLAEVEAIASQLSGKLKGDAVVWFAYPKKTSKKYKSEINRDCGWEPLGKLGLEGVRQVAIDEDWSALRFRKAEYIKSMTRDKKRAMSEEGKARQS